MEVCSPDFDFESGTVFLRAKNMLRDVDASYVRNLTMWGSWKMPV